MVFFCVITTAYLLGSIPVGYLVGRIRGIDIRSAGSGNIGATNVFRILGKLAGTLVLLADAAKGALACTVVVRTIVQWSALTFDPKETESIALAAGVAAILGHNYTCWLKFKGGKGIATSAGVLGAIVPIGLAASFTTWLIVFAASRYVSLASISAAVVLPFAVWLAGGSGQMVVITAGLSALAVLKHRSNIRRLIDGTENRIGSRQNAGEATSPRPASSQSSNSNENSTS